MTEETETGAEAGGEGYFAQIEAEQNAAEAADTPEPETKEAEPEAKPEDAKPEPEKEPLSIEEYQKRHDNINSALRQERAEKRQFKTEIDALRAEIDQMRQAQPQQFQQFTLDQRLADYEQVNWQAWQAQDPQAAQNGWNEFQALQAQRGQLQAQAEQYAAQMRQRNLEAKANEFRAAVDQSEATFRQAHQDYDDAVSFLLDSLAKEGMSKGFIGEQAQAYAQRQVVEIGLRVHGAGMDLAEFAYDQAKQRGYTPPMADIASVKAGAEAAKSISTLGTKTGAESGASFEETMSGLSGAAAKSYWEKAKAQRYA